ncbi:MAG: hypothetical protein V2I40_16765, partial [Desulfobacteraceae bacterium]|jgi:hypothetical protein|nr:hypothetical protein [Desulfobacteraceae bacterium]
MGWYHPAIGLWAPNILMGMGGIFLLIRTANEKPTYLFEFIRSSGRLVQKTLQQLLQRFMRR